MENKEGFHFTYSAAQQQEVENIRKNYLPKEEDKMEQLRRLHAIPTQKAQAASLAVGIIGALIMVFSRIGFRMPVNGWLICALSGIAQSVNYIVWVMALKTDAFMFASAVNNAAFIISVLAGLVLFDESLSIFKFLAILLIISAMYIWSQSESEAKNTWRR